MNASNKFKILKAWNTTDAPTTECKVNQTEVDKVEEQVEDEGPMEEHEDGSDLMINAAVSGRSDVLPLDVQRLLSMPNKKKPAGARCANALERSTVEYTVSSHKTTKWGALVDHGTNGGVAGTDVRLSARWTRQSMSLESSTTRWQDSRL